MTLVGRKAFMNRLLSGTIQILFLQSERRTVLSLGEIESKPEHLPQTQTNSR